MKPLVALTGICILLLAGCSTTTEPTEDIAQSVSTEAQLERGEYLAENLLICFLCHSEIDWQTPGLPVVAGTKAAGLTFADQTLPFPLTVPNISPDPETGSGNWTDEQWANALRNGIGHDGRILFPVMPYMSYRALSDDDLAAVIAYMRSIPPINHTPTHHELPPPVAESLQAPPPVETVPPPDLSTLAARGKYLVEVTECHGCHTPTGPDMLPIPGTDFSGGFRLTGPWGDVVGANITPDASGISYYDEATFINAMRTGNVGARHLNPIMPWGRFRNLTDEDLSAIWAYLQTLPPVVHRVDNTEPPTQCPLCGGMHGLGDTNQPRQ